MADELKLENITPKNPDDLTEEEKTYLNENKSQLTASQLEKFKSVLKNNEDEGDEGDEGDKGDEKD